jgi:hypothetical protein
MKIICNHCGTEEKYRTEKKANNLVAYCLECGRFIKNIPYSEPGLYFGKYSGTKIKDFNTPEHINYLHWLRNTPELWAKQNERVQQAINIQLDGKC